MRLCDTNGPAVVHCSAGIGRTGLLIALDIGLRALNAGDGKLDILRIVSTARQDRAGCVQTRDQYRFLHQVCSCICPHTHPHSLTHAHAPLSPPPPPHTPHSACMIMLGQLSSEQNKKRNLFNYVALIQNNYNYIMCLVDKNYK